MPGRLVNLAASERRFEHVLVAIIAAGFLSLLLALGAIAWMTGRTQEHSFWVSHTFRVELTAAAARQRLEQAEGVRRGLLIAPGHNFTGAFREAADGLPAMLDRLATLTRDNPHQQVRLARLRTMVGAQLARERTSFALIAAGHRDAALRAYADEVATRPVTAIRAVFDAVSAEERALLVVRDRSQRASLRTFYFVLMAAAILFALVAITTLLIVLRFTRNLTRSRDELGRLNDTLEDQVAERTKDLTRANEEIQRFAYIVSHDLRSPLVNVMGFTAELEAATAPLAELVDRAEERVPDLVTAEARDAAKQDLPEAIGFIRASTQKMDRLINAILKLSREGRRVLTPEPLDLDQLADGVVASIQHVIDDRGVTVTVRHPLPPIVSDRVGVEQILSNLVENATKYLQRGRPGEVAIAGQEERGRVTLTVADNGRGIDPRDHQRIFDLFRRSGQQDQPGEGIGLAHVRAMAYRLGGVIDVQSTLGEGSTFRVVLPTTLDLGELKA